MFMIYLKKDKKKLVPMFIITKVRNPLLKIGESRNPKILMIYFKRYKSECPHIIITKVGRLF